MGWLKRAWRTRWNLIAAAKNLVLLGAVVALLALAFETGVRLFTDTCPIFKMADDEVYLKYTPGMAAEYISQSNPSVRAPMRINRYGYRGPDWDLDAARKVAFLGDSFTVGRELPYEKTFVAEVEARLEAAGHDVACMNYAVDGTGTGMQLIHFERAVLGFAPDILVLQVYVGNDFIDNSRVLNWKRYYPYWTLADGELRLLEPELGIPVFMRLARHSRGLVFLYNQYRKLRMQRAEAAVSLAMPGLYAVDPPADWAEAYAVTLALLDRFAAVAEEHGVRLVVVLAPTLVQMRTDADFPEGFARRRPQDAILKRMAGKAACIDLLPLFREEARQRNGLAWWQIPGDGHFNQEAHAFVAQVIAGQVEDLWAPAP